MIFEDTEYMLEEHGEGYDEIRNPEVLKQLMEYIDNVKSKDRTAPIMDIIMHFAFKNNHDIEVLGDIISSDHYLKSFIESDSKYQLVKDSVEEW